MFCISSPSSPHIAVHPVGVNKEDGSSDCVSKPLLPSILTVCVRDLFLPAARQPLPTPPALSADESIQQSQAEHWQEEINGGDPGHHLEQPHAGHVLNGPALLALLGQAAFGVFHTEEEEDGAGGQEEAAPQHQDEPFHWALGDGRFGFQGKADGEVPLHAHNGDVQDGAVCVCFAQVNEELAEKIPKYVGLVLPKAVEVQRQAEENQDV